MQIQKYQKSTFQKVIPRMIEAGMDEKAVAREISFALQIINGSNQLSECSPESVLSAVINVANVGLTLNPAARESYLVSRWNSTKRCKEANLMPSYIGLCKLIVSAGMVSSIVSNVVHENDTFEIDLAASVKPVIHKPCLSSRKKGEIIGVYALATFPNGSQQCEWMDIDEIHRIRGYSDGYKYYLKQQEKGNTVSCVWNSDFNEMSRKTVLRRIYKYLPRGSGNETVDKAIDLDNQEYRISFNQLTKIETLLRTANITPEQIDQIEAQYSSFSFHRANECIAWLKENQLSETVQNGNYSATAINNSVQNALDDPKK